MAIDHIRYDILAQEALRGVVRTVLDDTAKHGLPGDHHFYITFDTRAAGVRIPARLTTQFPEEMTIVLQHQFWDLVINEDRFEVGMSFGGIPERLTIPFASIKGFVDPSVQFGLRFETLPDATAPSAQGSRPPAEHNQARTTPAITAVPKPAVPSAETPPDDDPHSPAGGEVVRLDRFRKK